MKKQDKYAQTELPQEELRVINGGVPQSIGVSPDFANLVERQATEQAQGADKEAYGLRPDFKGIAERQATEQAQGADGAPLQAIATTQDTPAVTKADGTPVSDYDYLRQFTDEYAPNTLTPAEMERRARRAHAIEYVGALGNITSALANLISVNKGAYSQTIPKNVSALESITKLEEREKAKRNEIYQRAKDRNAQAMQKEALQYKREQDKRNYDLKVAENDRKIREGEAKIKQIDANIKLAGIRGEKEEALKLKAERDAEVARVKAEYAEREALASLGLKYAQTNRAQKAAAASEASAGRTAQSQYERLYIGTDGDSFRIKKNDWNNPAILAGIAKILGIPVQVKKNGQEYDIEQDKHDERKIVSAQQLQALIGERMRSDAEKAEIIRQRYGEGGSGYEPTETPAQEQTAQEQESTSAQATIYPKGFSMILKPIKGLVSNR